MSVNGIKSGDWDPNQFSQSQDWKKKEVLEQAASFYSSSIVSLKPSEEFKQLNATSVSSVKTQNSSLSWIGRKLQAILDYFGLKPANVKELDVQQDHAKKSRAADEKKKAVRSAAVSKVPLQKQPVDQKSTNARRGFFDWTKDKFETVGEWTADTFQSMGSWFSEKWDSLLVTIGLRTSYISPERDRTRRARIMERKSPLEIDDDFKYLDLSTVDPLKAMLALLVRQGELREEQAFLIQQKILLMQEDLKDLHDERMRIHAELALVDKHYGVIEKVSIGITAAQVVAGVVSTAAVVAGAATIATGGAAAPATIPLLVVSGVLDGVVGGAQALNTWFRADSKEKLDRLQGQMLSRTSLREEMQFLLKVDVKDMRKVLGSLTGQAEIGSSLLSAQYGK